MISGEFRGKFRGTLQAKLQGTLQLKHHYAPSYGPSYAPAGTPSVAPLGTPLRIRRDTAVELNAFGWVTAHRLYSWVFPGKPQGNRWRKSGRNAKEDT